MLLSCARETFPLCRSTVHLGPSQRMLLGETSTSVRTLLKVKAVSVASRDAVTSETPLDGRRRSATACPGK
jgi:hypothetical protein